MHKVVTTLMAISSPLKGAGIFKHTFIRVSFWIRNSAAFSRKNRGTRTVKNTLKTEFLMTR